MRKFLILTLALIFGASTWICHANPKHKPQINQAQKDAGFRQLFASVFSEWDSNHDGILDLKEINAAIENPQIHGKESVVAVVFHRYLQKTGDDDENTNGLTLARALSLADEPEIQKDISGKAWHIEAVNHSLFAPGDPNLTTFHQGGVGDCYLLAVIGAFVYQHPQMVRTMIAPLADGTFQVQFGNGKKVIVEPVTDAELIMGANEGRNHGIWLSVLQKAYARLDAEAKERKTGEEIDPDDAVTTDFIGHGGYYSPVIVLLTGHKTMGAPLGRWLKQDPQGGLEKAHELLTKLSGEHRLMAVCTSKDKSKPLPKGIIHGHVFAVLGYNPASRTVTMFNPWGNHVIPAGAPGLANGYPTQHGIFEVPLRDFIQIFGGFTYETDRPALAAR